MKIVLDCNVIISAGLTDGVCRKVLWEVIQNHILYISEDILMEYKEVISREKFKTAKRYLYSLVEIICEVSELVVVKKFEFTLPDAKDLIYLNTALSSNSDYLITGNKKDFPEEKYITTKIISPNDFLNL